MILQCICGHGVRLMLQFYLHINGVMCMLKQFSEAIYKLNQWVIINMFVYILY